MQIAEETKSEQSVEIEIGGSMTDMMTFASEVMAARRQQQQLMEGRQILLTERQQDAVRAFADREVSPYFSKSRDAGTESRLREIAQSIKKKSTATDADGKRSKPMFTTSAVKSSEGEADGEEGYQTALENPEDDAAPKVNRSWYLPKKIEKFMQPSEAESAFDKSERRAMDLRSRKKAQILEKSRSKMRGDKGTSTNANEETKVTPSPHTE